MPDRDGYPHGVPSWVDLGTTDVAAAQAFYTGLFDWEAADIPTGQDGMSYTLFTKRGKVVAGCGPVPSTMPQVAFWNSYVNVDDVDAVVAAADAAGATILMPAMDVMDQGRMAFILDPTGAAIGFWQAGAHRGAQVVNEHGALVWNELMTDDVDAAKAFYGSVLGWEEDTSQMDGGPVYTSFKVGGRDIAGMMQKTPDMQFPNYWNVYFAVDDVDAAFTRVQELGGNGMPPFDTPVGRMAVVFDPQGANFSIIAMTDMDA